MLIRGFQYGGGSGSGGGASSDGPANAIQISNGTGGFVGESAFSYDPTTNTVNLASGVQVADNPALNISQTWNNAAGAFIGLKFNVTNTASKASHPRPSELFSLAVNGIPHVTITPTRFFLNEAVAYNDANRRKAGFGYSHDANLVFYRTYQATENWSGTIADYGWILPSTFCLAWGSTNTAPRGAPVDLLLVREAAGTLAQRNSTNAQTFRVYNTHTDASNYERLSLRPGAASGWMQIAAETAGTGADNIGLALSPAGTGAISAHVPDSTAAGGNARGGSAVDFQISRNNAAQVASGVASVVAGGSLNRATALYATSSGGTSNTASGESSTVCGGQSNTAGNTRATVCGGILNTASGISSLVGGGANNTASGTYSWIPGGYYGTTRGLIAARAYAGNRRAADGDAQVIGQPVRNSTASTSATTLTTDAAAVGSSNVMVLPNNSSAGFRARVAARNATNVGSGSWEICGTIERGANAASTAIVGATTIRAFGISASLGSPTVDVVADTTQGAAVIQVTAANSDTTYWVGDIELIQVA